MGASVQRITADTGRIDAIHFCLKLFQRKMGKCILPAHQTTCAVGRGAVPVRIALADADQTPVAHIDGDQQLLPFCAETEPFRRIM